MEWPTDITFQIKWNVFLAKANKEMIRIMILKNIIKYEHDGVEEDDDKNGCN